MTQAYPLQWPDGWPRTDPTKQKAGKFTKMRRRTTGSGHTFNVQDALTIHQAVQRIGHEVRAYTRMGRPWRIDPDEIVISTNVDVRRSDGMPRSDRRAPDDPGAALYFTLDGKAQAIPCDRYTEVAQNLAAIAATLEALRALERHGSGIMERAFTGFQALPSPNAHVDRPWWEVLNVRQDAPRKEIRTAYLRLRSVAHGSGDGERLREIQRAWRESE